MEVKELILNDGSGGLNTREHPSKIKQNEFSILENVLTDDGGWPGKKRGGQELLQYAPPDPVIGVIDVNTMARYPLDDVSGSVALVDASAVSGNLTKYSIAISPNVRVPGILPTAAPFAQEYRKLAQTDPFPPIYFQQAATPRWGINGKANASFEGWIYIKPSFSGAPINFNFLGAATTYQTGATIFGTNVKDAITNLPIGIWNGITIHRDYDAALGVDVSDPYFKFTLHTNGIHGKITILQSNYVSAGTWLFVRGTYNSSTLQMVLSVNGSEVSAVVAGGGTIDNTQGLAATIGGHYGQIITPAFDRASIVGDYLIDEVNISDIVRTTFPFKEPRGKPWKLIKANGVKQVIISAGDSLFFSVGNTLWQKINTATYDILGPETFSAIAYWDAVQIGDILYLQNGVDSPKAWDGLKLYPWGEPVTSPNLALAIGTGIGSIALFTYFVTFMYGTIETGPGPSVSLATTANNQRIEFTNIPLGAPGCTARRIYRRKNTGANAGKFYFLRQISDNISTTLTGLYAGFASPLTDTGGDGLPEGTLSTGAYTEILAEVLGTKIPKGKYLLSNHGRAWITGMPDNPYDLDWSESNGVHAFRPTNFVRAQSDSGPLVGMANYYGEIHVSKNGKATLVLRGDNPSNWTNLEILHPTIGSVDHWSYVHRVVPQSDNYRLCFWGEDGAYAYAGHDFEKISDRINPTLDNKVSIPTQNQSAFLVTSKNDWEAAVGQNGSITLNMYAPSYDTDGIREDAGKLKIVDQLSYLGLNRPNGLPNTFSVVSICKGQAEGEFFFGTKNDSNLYRTTDNFQTAVSVLDIQVSGMTPAANGMSMRIIEIVKKGIAEEYFFFTDRDNGLGGSGGGYVFKWNQATLTATQIYVAVLQFFEFDTLMRYASAPASLFTLPGAAIGRGIQINQMNQVTFTANLKNIYLTHAQKVFTTKTDLNSMIGFSNTASQSSTTGLGYDNQGSGVDGFASVAAGPGFIAANSGFGFGFVPGFTLEFAHREFAAWQGGTCRPQAFWDATNSRLWYVAADVADAQGRRLSQTFHLTEAGVRSSMWSGYSQMALTQDGITAYIIDSQASNADGMRLRLIPITLATGLIVSLYSFDTAPNTLVKQNGYQNYLTLRIGFNPNSTRLLLTGKAYNETDRDSLNYKGFFGSVTLANLPTSVGMFPITGSPNYEYTEASNTAAFPMEQARQTTNPQAFMIASQNISATDSAALFLADAVNMQIVEYKPVYDSSLGTISNLIFVPSSGVAGGNLWSDRFYYASKKAAAGVEEFIQIGVPGDWSVIGTYVSAAFNAVSIGYMGAFEADFSGNLVSFFLRNAAAIPGLAATETPVTPNTQVNAFPNPQAILQFKITENWTYVVGAAPTTSPEVSFVQMDYASAAATQARIVAFNWRGRTYWALSEFGNKENNIVAVYQKNGAWTTYKGWAIKGFNEFNGAFIALQKFELVKLEVGSKDLGNLIRTKARSGYIMDDTSDKCIRDINLNTAAYMNTDAPGQSGWMKVVPYGGDTKLPAEWVCEIPYGTTKEPRQTKGNFVAPTFPYEYARAFAIEVYTSDDNVGTYKPAVGQDEVLASLILKLFVSSPRELIVRK